MTNDFSSETEIALLIPHYVEFIRKDIAFYIKDEGYKYFAVAKFRKEFDIDAQDLADMLKTAFSKTNNLVGSGKYYPARMLYEYALKDKEFVRDALRSLLDHSVDVGKRVDGFIDSMNEHFKQTGVQSYFDYRFVSFILSALYPEKYIYVKPVETTKLAKQINYALSSGRDSTKGEKYVEYLRFSELVRSVLSQSPEFVVVHNEIVVACDYKDSSMSWGTIDFIFNCVRRLGSVEFKDHATSVARRASYKVQAIEQFNDVVVSEEFYEPIHQMSKDAILEQALAYVPIGDGYKNVESVGRVRIDSAIQKLRVKELEDHTCQVCGTIIEYKNSQGKIRRFAHADHIQDKAKGGNEALQNLWVLCPNCHALKTYGVIVIDVLKKKVFKGGSEITIRDHHLGWNDNKS